jgi:ribonucleoside-diphosphate reductase alpha subunit
MFVIKRDSVKEEISFDKITKRIQYLIQNPYHLNLNAYDLAQRVIQTLYNNINTYEIDNHTANLAASLSIENNDYSKLAGRIVINDCHKNTLPIFSDKVAFMYNRKIDEEHVPLVSKEYHDYVMANKEYLNNLINYEKDYEIDFFGFRTLQHSYLLKDKTLIERPQDMYMRVSVFIHMNTSNDLNKIKETYDLMSEKYFIHATPTLFNAGTNYPALASCFLLGTHDSLQGIMKTATDCANISKLAGGIGFHFSNWRSEGSIIHSTNGKSSGVVPFLRIFNDVARAFNQGGKRLGSFVAYIEPHHPDIMNFLQLRRNNGDENLRTRDLFLGLWISDLFMKRVVEDKMWSTFDPNTCPGLNDCFGNDYEKLYLKYESEGKSSVTLKARDVWYAVFTLQKESGLPYILYKDNVNHHNNQNNLGIIKSSNLCCEITIYSDDKEYGTCHLASICLPKFVKDRNNINDEFPSNPYIDYKKLSEVAMIVCTNLNNIIDKNLYPCPEAKLSSEKGRPIGIGVQGLADVFFKFKIPFDSEKAKHINKCIFEAIYYGAMSASTKLAKSISKTDKSGSYPHFLKNGGSHLANGKFHWELYGLTNNNLSGMFDWETLREHIAIYGIRNSLLTALMPTASTSQINGNIECFEPVTSNIYKRKVLSGEYIIINKYLIRDLQAMDLWNQDIINYLKVNGGSIQGIDGLSPDFKKLYRTVWEIPQKSIIEMASARQPFVDQAQSMNLFFQEYNFDKFTAAQVYAWKQKLKTGSYYIRTQAAINPQKFTVNPKDIERMKKEYDNDDDTDICLLCSS